MPTVTYNAFDFASLNNAIASADGASLASGGSGTNYVINITSGINLSSMYAINLAGNDSITINGNGATLDGGGVYRGFFVYAGTVVINDVTIQNAVARGGNGGFGGGGGGAGLGGAVFVSSSGRVTLNDVSMFADGAIGGNGGNSPGDSQNRGGGGGGGLGGDGGSQGLEAGGGGGIGLDADGGGSSNGGGGIVYGAAGDRK